MASFAGTMEGMLDRALASELARIVGDSNVLTDDDLRAGYERDWTGRFRGSTPMVVRPGSTVEVSAVLERCSAAGVRVVPQGGNTGLVGGGVPLGGELVLSLRRLDELGQVDHAALQVTAGAGVTLAALQEHARTAGLDFGVDLAARGSATVGGMIATNAGGVHVIRHGPMRDQLVGIEAVTSQGRVLSHLGGLEKDNTGYDLTRLLCGSEGTLAVITRARLRLVRRPKESAVAVVGVDSIDSAVGLVAHLRSGLAGLSAVEVLIGDAMPMVTAHLAVDPVLESAAAHVLVEIVGETDCSMILAESISEAEGVTDAVVASGPGGQLRLWQLRDSLNEAIAAQGIPQKFDVTIPFDEMTRFVEEVPAHVEQASPGARVVLFGHLGDGNLHVNVLGAGRPVEREVLELVAGMGGSISAEHGIGTAKAPYLGLARSPDEIAVFRALRRALDPGGILNPAVMVEA